MALNIHTDPRFEKCLRWLSKQTQKTKTDVIKELVWEKYHWKRFGFQFGALKIEEKTTPGKLQTELKKLDEDHDLD